MIKNSQIQLPVQWQNNHQSTQIQVSPKKIQLLSSQTTSHLAKNKNNTLFIYKKLKNQSYRICQSFLQNHTQLSKKHRLVLCDWLMQVAYQFQFKRQTYALSILLLDKFLCKFIDISRQKFQLVGITCLFIIAKVNEVKPHQSQNYIKVCNDLYTIQQLIQMQQIILNVIIIDQKVNFNIVDQLTYVFWSGWIMKLWDEFSMCRRGQYFPMFLNKDQNSYKNFRMVMQILDCLYLKSQTYYYQTEQIVLATIAIFLKQRYQNWSLLILKQKYFNIVEQSIINIWIEQMYETYFQFDLRKHNKLLEYVMQMFQITFVFDAPKIKNVGLLQQKKYYQQFISVQTFNKYNQPFILTKL